MKVNQYNNNPFTYSLWEIRSLLSLNLIDQRLISISITAYCYWFPIYISGGFMGFFLY